MRPINKVEELNSGEHLSNWGEGGREPKFGGGGNSYLIVLKKLAIG